VEGAGHAARASVSEVGAAIATDHHDLWLRLQPGGQCAPLAIRQEVDDSTSLAVDEQRAIGVATA
jgi:hypothetical protein